MSVIRIRRSDSIDLITSPVSSAYRMVSPHLYTIRRVLSVPDMRMTTGHSGGHLDTSSSLYGLSGSRNDYSLYRHKNYRSPQYDRSTKYSFSYKPYYRDYSYRQRWGNYGRPPYVPYLGPRPTPSSSFQWWYYPTAFYYPRIVRTDFLDTGIYFSRRFREPYYVRSQFEYNARYRRWAYWKKYFGLGIIELWLWFSRE